VPSDPDIAREIAGPCTMGPTWRGGNGSDIHCRCYTGNTVDGWVSHECELVEKITTALQAERDAAYARGWRTGIEAAARLLHVYNANISGLQECELAKAIRSLSDTPPPFTRSPAR